MSSALNQIEDEIIEKLKLIDGGEHSWAGVTTKYKFYTTCGQVNMRDDTLATVGNKITDKVNFDIEVGNEEMYESQSGANCQRFRVAFDIICSPKCDEIGITKNIINKKMNDVLSDLKYIFNKNETLDNTCYYFQYQSSRREYTQHNDMINGGKIIATFVADYGSFFTNPDIITNNNFI